MRKKGAILPVFLLLQILSTGQQVKADPRIDPIAEYTRQINYLNYKGDSLNLVMDSIAVNAVLSRERIICKCLFEQSKTMLTIYYYIKRAELVCTRIEEQSPFVDDLYRASVFYYENEKLFGENYFRTVRACMAIPLDNKGQIISEYNPSLSPVFLKKFVWELYQKLKTQQLIV